MSGYHNFCMSACKKGLVFTHNTVLALLLKRFKRSAKTINKKGCQEPTLELRKKKVFMKNIAQYVVHLCKKFQLDWIKFGIMNFISSSCKK